MRSLTHPSPSFAAFKPKQAPSGTKQYQLKKFAESTLVRVFRQELPSRSLLSCASRPSLSADVALASL